MKKKTRFLRISLLMLCLTVLMFGVYAVSKSATLTTSGTVGLVAHDCKVNVKASISGDGVLTSEDENLNPIYTPDISGFVSPERQLFERVIGGDNKDVWDVTEDIGTVYFTDLTESGIPETITLKFEITNLSEFNVSINVENLDLENITTLSFEEGYQSNSKDCQAVVLKDESINIYVTFDLNETNGDYLTLENLNFETKLNFGKYAGGVLKAPTLKSFDLTTKQLELNNVFGSTGYVVEWVDANTNEVVSRETFTQASNQFLNMPNKAGDFKIKTMSLGDGEFTEDSIEPYYSNVFTFESVDLPSNFRDVLGGYISLGNITDIRFDSVLPDLEVYSLREDAVIADGVEVYASADSSKVYIYSPKIITITNGVNVFMGWGKLKNITFNNFSLNKVNNIQGMFAGLTTIESIDLSNVNMSSVLDMNNMFLNCHALKNLDMSNTFATNVKNLTAFIAINKNMTNYDLTGFNFSKVTTWENFTYQSSGKSKCIKVANATQYNLIKNADDFNMSWVYY